MKRIEKIWNESKRDPELKGLAICDMIDCEDCVCHKMCERPLSRVEVKTKYETLINWADEELDADPAIDKVKAENKRLRAMFWTMVSLRYDAKRESIDNLIQFSLFTDPDKLEKIMAERDRFVRYSASAKSKAKEANK